MFLLLLTGSLLFFQWKAYSSQNESEASATTEQTINIKHVEDEFLIEQTIESVPSGTYKLDVPQKTEGLICIEGNDGDCSLSGTTLHMTKSNKVVFTYKLPAPANPKSYLMRNWAISIKGLETTTTRVQIAEKQWRTGSWVAAADKIGKRKMDYVDYYVFTGKGSIPALYWQQKEMQKTKIGERFVIYSEQELPKDIHIDPPIDINITSEKEYYSIVTDLHDEEETGTLLIVNSFDDIKGIQVKMTRNDVAEAFIFHEEEKWFSDVIASIILSNPVGSEKAQRMYFELTNRLEGDELTAWLKNIVDLNGNQLDSKKMDHITDRVTGFKTTFFSDNRDLQAGFVPISFFDARDVYISDEKAPNVFVTYQDGKAFIAIRPLLELLGYEVNASTKGDMIIAEKGAVNYRFYPDKRIFSLNSNQYGLQSAPVIRLQNKVYVQLVLVDTFFNVRVIETEEKITIK